MEMFLIVFIGTVLFGIPALFIIVVALASGPKARARRAQNAAEAQLIHEAALKRAHTDLGR